MKLRQNQKAINATTVAFLRFFLFIIGQCEGTTTNL